MVCELQTNCNLLVFRENVQSISVAKILLRFFKLNADCSAAHGRMFNCHINAI